MKRFAGSCELIGPVEVDHLVAWIGGIGFEEWPQQHRLPDGKIRPAMVTDPQWHGFGAGTEEIVQSLMSGFDGCIAYQRMLSVVMPGHSIAPHRDEQSRDWLFRVHVPLMTNPESLFIVEDVAHQLAPGFAYRVNTEAIHAVTNDGDSPRIHFMFDVGSKC